LRYSSPRGDLPPSLGREGEGLLDCFPPLPCRGGVGGGVSIVLTANGDTDPTPAPPLEGRGVQRMIYVIYRTYPKRNLSYYAVENPRTP